MVEDRELWTRLVMRGANGYFAEAWTKQPVAAVSDAIQKRHPLRLENGEYIHPDTIVRFYSWELWNEKKENELRINADIDKHVQEMALARAAKQNGRRWYHRLVGA